MRSKGLVARLINKRGIELQSSLLLKANKDGMDDKAKAKVKVSDSLAPTPSLPPSLPPPLPPSLPRPLSRSLTLLSLSFSLYVCLPPSVASGRIH